MAAYQAFTSTRTTIPDLAALLVSLRSAVSAEVGIQYGSSQQYTMKKDTTWQAAEVAAAQAVIDAAPALTPQRAAQNEIDAWPLALKALVLALIDQLNVIRAALPTPLPAITPAQAVAAVRAKAGTL